MTGFGAFLSSNHPPERQWDLARRVDALGFDSIWTGDHVSFHLPRYELCGVPHRERGARVTEAIDVLRTLWRDSPASFAGRFTRFDGASIEPGPVQKPGPPILIGGRSDAALARAARQGDGWVSYVVTSDGFARSLEKIRRFAAASELLPRLGT
jgi:alkanesulfonate monooxygenase SsuD/methylene tetrahydromethanopterin reductase-like flavin-dependent oxidoreductase (luciferase family)